MSGHGGYGVGLPETTGQALRRGAGVVERGGLENRCALTSTEGSNPSLSATHLVDISRVFVIPGKSGNRRAYFPAIRQ